MITFRAGENEFVNTGVSVVQGVTYSFVLNIDPESEAWQGNISTSDNQEFSSGQMGYRLNAGTGRYVNFNTLMINEQATWTYSLDGLSVIPEPSTIALLFGGAAFLMLGFRRRSR